jgi:hypothetical protein
LACLTPTQKDVACLLAEATLLQGVTSLPFESLELLTAMGPGRQPFAGLSKADLSLAISGGPVRGGGLQKGLKHFEIVVLDERGPLERGIQCTILTVMADAQQWGVPLSGWRYTASDKAEWLSNVAACRRSFTPRLGGLLAEPDLLDARAAVAAESVVNQAVDALSNQPPTTLGACRAGVLAADALRIRDPRSDARESRGRSDIRNAETPAKARCVPTFGTHTRARLLNRKQKTETVQQLNSARQADDSNRLLAMLAEQFARVHGKEWTAKEMENSGAAWRMVARAWPDEFEIQVGEMRNFLNGGGKIKCAWAYFQTYFKRAVGQDTWASVCEKSKESFVNPTQARI